MPDESTIVTIGENPFVANYYPSDLVGYVYDADTHCVACSEDRFGHDLQLLVAGGHQNKYPYDHKEPEAPEDSEGNLVSAITGDMEFQCSLFCGDCHEDMSERVTIIHYVPKGKRVCQYCHVNKKNMTERVYLHE